MKTNLKVWSDVGTETGPLMFSLCVSSSGRVHLEDATVLGDHAIHFSMEELLLDDLHRPAARRSPSEMDDENHPKTELGGAPALVVVPPDGGGGPDPDAEDNMFLLGGGGEDQLLKNPSLDNFSQADLRFLSQAMEDSRHAAEEVPSSADEVSDGDEGGDEAAGGSGSEEEENVSSSDDDAMEVASSSEEEVPPHNHPARRTSTGGERGRTPPAPLSCGGSPRPAHYQSAPAHLHQGTTSTSTRFFDFYRDPPSAACEDATHGGLLGCTTGGLGSVDSAGRLKHRIDGSAKRYRNMRHDEFGSVVVLEALVLEGGKGLAMVSWATVGGEFEAGVIVNAKCVNVGGFGGRAGAPSRGGVGGAAENFGTETGR